MMMMQGQFQGAQASATTMGALLKTLEKESQEYP